MNRHLYCIGGATIDYKLKSIYPLELATSNPVSSFQTMGGVARNVAENLSYLTNSIYLQCVVGDDDDGRRLLTHLQNKNINVDSSLIVNHKPTAHYYAVLDQMGEMHIALADMEIYDQIPFDAFIHSWEKWPENSIIFIDTNLPASIIEHAIQFSENKKFILCVDAVSITKAKKLPTSLDGIFLLKTDQHEARALTGVNLISIADGMQAGEILLNRGVKNVVISLGKSGYLVVNETQREYFPALTVDFVTDVSGAGDAFFAGILVGLQQNFSIIRACQLGSAAAALTVQAHDTVAGNFTLADLIRLANFNERK